MKIFSTAAAILTLSAGAAFAQSTTPDFNRPVTTSANGTTRDVTGFTAHNAPAVAPESVNRPANPHVVLKPRTTGIFVDGGKYGTKNDRSHRWSGMGQRPRSTFLLLTHVMMWIARVATPPIAIPAGSSCFPSSSRPPSV